MINNINKNISVWRGEITPPTEYHVWIKSNGSVLINKDGTWLTLISESTNDSVNVCNLSNVGYQPTLATAILTVSAYLGTKVFHVGYKLRYNEAPVGYDPIWKEYILTGSNWYMSDNWKLVFTTDLMNNEEIIKSGHLPSYVDDVLEYSTIDEFPTKGESGKIYLDTSTNKSYRWSGTQYVLIALTDIVTSESDGLMSSEMYNKLEQTAIDLDNHDKQNLADFTRIRELLDQKVGKIVDSQGNIISEDVSISTIPDGTSDTRGLLTPAIYKLVEDNKKMSKHLDDNKVEEIRNFLGTPFLKVGSIVTIPNVTSQSAGLMASDDKIKLDSIESEFVKDLGLVASTDEGDLIAARSEIAGNVKISFIRYRTAGVRAEKVTTIFLWRNGVNETAQLKFVDKALWRRNVIGATGVEGATTSTTPWERTGAHYLGYDTENRKIQLMDYNQTAFRDVQLPLATETQAGLMSVSDKGKLDGMPGKFVLDLGQVSSETFGDDQAAKSEIAGNRNIFAIRYTTKGVSALKTTVIIQWCNGINECAQIKFADKSQWRRNVTGATGVAGAPTNAFKWERTGAHYLGYDAANRKIQLMDYNLTVFKTVLLPLALHDADVTIDGLISSEDIASIITKADFDRYTGEIHLKNKENNQVTYFVIPPATKDGMGLMTENDVIEMGTLTEHRIDRNNPHNVTKVQVGLGNVTNDAQVKRSEMGLPDGVALLNSDGKIPSSYLPSYVSDIITVDSYVNLPTTGEEDKIYVTKDTNLTYRWSGTNYVEISPSLALGETSTTAYAGDKGKDLSNSVYDLKNRVGYGYLDTETLGYAKIGTGDTRVKIVPGADILASVVGQGTSFTISSNTDTASIGYGASIGLNSVLGAGLSASISNVEGPDGSTRRGIVLKDVNDDNGIKILGRNWGEFLVGTSVNNNNWIDLARLGKISTMISVSSPSGLSIDPSVLTTNSSDSEISIGTNTSIGSNVTIGSYVEIGEGIVLKNDSTGYVLLGDGTTKIKKGVTIDGNSGSSELRVHEYLGSWLIGEDLIPTATTAKLGKGIIIVGTNATNRPMLIKAGGATALIGANFNAYSGVTLGSYSSLGNLAKLGDNVEIILGASGLTIVSNDYGMTIGTKVSIGNNVSLGNNVIISDDISISTSVSVSDMGDEVSVGGVTIATGINITKNTAATTILNNNVSSKQGGKLTFGTGNIIWDGVEIGTGVHITENLTSDSTSYKLGGTNLATIGKNAKLGASLGIADNSYTLDDPNINLRISTIGLATEIYSEVTIGTGIQIQDSPTDGLQIYSPSRGRWITIS